MSATRSSRTSLQATGAASSTDRILSIPSLFTEQRPIWTVEEMAQALGLPISTAYRYFQSLLRFGFLDEAPGQGYCLGPAFIEFDRAIRLSDPVARLAKPIMADLAPRMPPGTQIILCRAYRKKIMCIDQLAVLPLDSAINYERGRPMPFPRGATSKVILAHLSWRRQKREFEDNTDTMKQAGLGKDWNAFRSSLRDIRKQGYCISRGEVETGRMGIAAPIFGAQGKVPHSLSAVVWRPRVDERGVDAITRHIVDAAERLSRSLTHRDAAPACVSMQHGPTRPGR